MHAYAVLENDATITQIEIADPVPEGSEIVLKVLRAGVCHTDTHLRAGGYDLGSRGILSLAARGVPYPLIMGHEVVGLVESVGEDVLGTHPGDVRLLYPWIGCGRCTACTTGAENRCANGQNLGVARHGGYAERIVVPHERYLIDIEGLDPSWAATLACSGLTAMSAVRKVLPLPSDAPVVVIGAGGLGLTAIACLVMFGHRNICAVDVSEQNLEIARELGATITVVADATMTSAAITAACGGPVEAIIDFVNSSQTAPIAFDSLIKGGHLVQVGLFGGEFTIPTALMALKVLRIEGSFVGSLAELRDLVGLARAGNIPSIPIITAALDAASVSDSLDRLVLGGVRGRIVLMAQ